MKLKPDKNSALTLLPNPLVGSISPSFIVFSSVMLFVLPSRAHAFSDHCAVFKGNTLLLFQSAFLRTEVQIYKYLQIARRTLYMTCMLIIQLE